LETQDPNKTKTTEEIQNLVIEQTSKQNTIDNLKRKEKFKDSNTQEPSEDNLPLTATDTKASTNKPKIKKEPTKRKMEIINLDDDVVQPVDDDDFMSDVHQPKKTKIKKRTNFRTCTIQEKRFKQNRSIRDTNSTSSQKIKTSQSQRRPIICF